MLVRIHIFYLIIFIAISGCNTDSSSEAGRVDSESDFKEGALRMRDTLDLIFANTDFRNHPYESGERIKVMEQELRDLQASGGQSDNPIEYGRILLDAGRSTDAIYMLNKIIEANPSLQEVTDRSKGLYETLGIAYLRMGEQENCIRNHNEETCIYPIQGKGVHQYQQGSRGAVDIYLKILDEYPEDYQSMYLLNLAYQTLGEYPENVPKRFLLPSGLFQSEKELPRWSDVASRLGIADNLTAGGAILDDFNKDGFIDLITSSWHMRTPLKFYHNNGDGSFSDKTKEAGLETVTGGLNMVQADYNNDGNLDFLLLRGAWKPHKEWAPEPNSLFRNNGDGTFSDVTFESGIFTMRPTQTAVWFDFNNDGWLDLFIGNETMDPNTPWPCEFYINQKDGTFKESSRETGIPMISHVKGAVAGDFNNDGWMDLFISVQGGENILYMNRDGNTFTFDNSRQVSKPIFSFPVMSLDIDHNGWEDLVVVAYDFYGSIQQSGEVTAHLLGKPTITEFGKVYLNKEGEFDDKAAQYNFDQPVHGMGVNFGDLTNDGWLDIYIGTGAPDYRSIVPNRMFFNENGKTFLDVTESGGFGNIQKGHAIAFADVDNDGDQDVYANLGGAYSGDYYPNSFLLNPGNENNWITLRLEGTTSNKSAIGARVRLTLMDENGEKQVLYHTCGPGGSFGCNSLQMEIGLRKSTQVEKVEVNWPNGENVYEDFGSSGVNRIVKLIEGESKVRSVQFDRIKWKLASHTSSNTVQ